MNLSLEKEIVDSFYQKWCRKRLKWELETDRARADAIWKMRKVKYLEERKMHLVEYLSTEELKRKIVELGGINQPYMMSVGFVGELSFEEAIYKFRQDDMGAILYFGNGVGYYHEGELDKFAPEYILLK